MASAQPAGLTAGRLRRLALCCILAGWVLPPAAQSLPDESRPGPWDNDVWILQVRPGAAPERIAGFERAGVPTLARLPDGRLLAAFQHFPRHDPASFDRVAASFSSDQGRSWSPPQPIRIQDFESDLARPFDPTLVVLPDGRIRIYFTSHRQSGRHHGTPEIHSAVSSDGIDYRFEPGVRFAVAGRRVIDSAVAMHAGQFHMIVPDNGAEGDGDMQGRVRPEPAEGIGYHAISRDGLHFERQADLRLPGRGRWLGNLVSDGGRLLFFGTGPGPWPASSADGRRWDLPSASVAVPGADPGVVRLPDGSWLLAVTSPPRAGSASYMRQLQRDGPVRNEQGSRRAGQRGERVPDIR